ncbi:hypothetical protein [Entomospira culicis]|uniref:Uncharacterized protein n=1 Tax=Entomospira culicis TaxID=2719989 RepID=A0A968GF00_9SPIO|nr:hypothetical protein [Entomospira culicis]NIZ19110.1 hypothetical protein [Entomospira culicis]NIZ69324.1 hypothetical protein [Entomospira culicis]WDI37910.1 hypothetical protein PVA46_03735 [Entomospira culicis]WDI39537.1 hypothetical protein PVA47_03735 [Entomospira culicis]
MMKKILLIAMLCGSSVVWGQVAPKYDHNNPVELIIILTEATNEIIRRYEALTPEALALFSEHQQAILSYLYELAIEIKSDLARMSHADRLLTLGMLYGVMHSSVLENAEEAYLFWQD